MTTNDEVCSRLFLSADLIGSTERKQRTGTSAWISEVLAFYQQFPVRLATEIAAAVERTRAGVATFELHQRPTLWKPVGDELICTAEIRSEHDVQVLVDAWIAAMQTTAIEVLGKAGLDLKGAAWIATFPFPDRAIAVPMDPSLYEADLEPEVVNRQLLEQFDEGEHQQVRIDYLGPSIDTGFRIAAHATARQFTVSFEVAWALAAAQAATGDGARALHFSGEVALKGVWAGRGYPLFWLDTGNHHAARPLLDQLSRIEPVDALHVRQLAEPLRSEDDWPSRLYLPDSHLAELRRDGEEIRQEAERLAEVDDTSTEVPDLGED